MAKLDLAKRRVSVRAAHNPPHDHGRVRQDTRLRAVVPTIQYALKAGASVVLASHLGRPKGKVAPEFSLRPIAERLEPLLDQRVELAPDCVGPATLARARALSAGQGPLLEKPRFPPGGETNQNALPPSLPAPPARSVNHAFPPP